MIFVGKLPVPPAMFRGIDVDYDYDYDQDYDDDYVVSLSNLRPENSLDVIYMPDRIAG